MSIRRLSLAGAVVAALLLLPAGASAAPPPGTITILDRDRGSDVLVDGEPVVCAFAVELDFEVDAPVPVVGWVIKVWASTAFDGATVLSGSDGPTDADGRLRQPRDGWLTLPDGRYNLLVDDETPVDRSYARQPFTVDCEADATPTPTATATPTPTATATPTPTPVPTGGTAPTPTPTATGEVLPTQGVATPTPAGPGAGLPAEGDGQPTLPPTDAMGEDGGDASQGAYLPWILLLVSLGVLVLTPGRRPRDR